MKTRQVTQQLKLEAQVCKNTFRGNCCSFARLYHSELSSRYGIILIKGLCDVPRMEQSQSAIEFQPDFVGQSSSVALSGIGMISIENPMMDA